MNSTKQNLASFDPDIEAVLSNELSRGQQQLQMIASENYASPNVQYLQGSVLTNKYAEGYSGKRFYNGCIEVDKAEDLAIARAKELFGCDYANVQPHSGSQANQAVFLALLEPGDCILAMSLDAGGHLTHGAAPNMSGKWFKPVFYGVKKDDYLLDYEELRQQALKHKPKLIIAGYSCYSRQIDFAKFRAVADEVGAYLLADIAHISGLVAAGQHPSPFPYADIVTSTTHKTLRGPRGGIILCNNADMAKKLNRAIFPGLQGGPFMHIIAAKAVAFKEALAPEFISYIKQVVINCQALCAGLKLRGYDMLTGGTDNHMAIIDLRNKNITGKDAANYLEQAGIVCNKNSIPFDDTSPFITSGIRLGTPALTTRGFKDADISHVANLIADTLDAVSAGGNIEEATKIVKTKVLELTGKFPIYEVETDEMPLLP